MKTDFQTSTLMIHITSMPADVLDSFNARIMKSEKARKMPAIRPQPMVLMAQIKNRVDGVKGLDARLQTVLSAKTAVEALGLYVEVWGN